MALSQGSLMSYLRDKLGVDTADVTGDTPLFSSSLVDSFSMVDLMMFIEREARIRVNPTDVNLDNFDSVDRILRYVDRRTDDK